MTISARHKSFLAEILKWKPIPEDKLVYFRERLRDRLHSAILNAFLARAEERGLKQKDLAARIHRTDVQITRWLSAPSNLRLDSISDLMVGLGMDFDEFPFSPIEKTIVTEVPRQEREEAAATVAVSDLLHTHISDTSDALHAMFQQHGQALKRAHEHMAELAEVLQNSSEAVRWRQSTLYLPWTNLDQSSAYVNSIVRGAESSAVMHRPRAATIEAEHARLSEVAADTISKTVETIQKRGAGGKLYNLDHYRTKLGQFPEETNDRNRSAS